MDYSFVLVNITNRDDRKLPINYGIPVLMSKFLRPGKQSLFLTPEKSAKVLMEVINLFTPMGVFSVDIYGSTITKSPADLMKYLCCFSIEKDIHL